MMHITPSGMSSQPPCFVAIPTAVCAKRARYLLGFLHNLEHWAMQDAYFQNAPQKEEVLKTIRTSIAYFEGVVQRSKSG